MPGREWSTSGEEGSQGGHVEEGRDETRERIMRSALEVLRDVGYGQFSVQKVARAAGVYQGNITYYWPRRRDLVLALAIRVIEDYRSACLETLTRDGSSVAERAVAVVRRMVDEAVRPDRVRLLPELWSMANGDPDIARAMIRTHDEVLEVMLEGLGASEFGDRLPEIRRILLLVGAAIQGLTALHGHRGPDDPVLREAKEAIVTQHAVLMTATLGDGTR